MLVSAPHRGWLYPELPGVTGFIVVVLRGVFINLLVYFLENFAFIYNYLVSVNMIITLSLPYPLVHKNSPTNDSLYSFISPIYV